MRSADTPVERRVTAKGGYALLGVCDDLEPWPMVVELPRSDLLRIFSDAAPRRGDHEPNGRPLRSASLVSAMSHSRSIRTSGTTSQLAEGMLNGETVEPSFVTRAQAVRDVLIQVVGRLANLLLGAVVVVIITRSLGVLGNGQWSTLMAISAITAYIVDPGLQTATVRVASANPDAESGLLGALFVLRLVTGIVAAAVCFGVSAAVSRGSSMLIAAALISCTALTSPLAALGIVFQLRIRNDRTIAFLTLNSLLWTAAAGVVALAGGGLVAFAATSVGTYTLASAAQAAYVLRRTPLVLSGLRDHARPLIRIALVLGIGGVLIIAYGKIDQVLVLHYTGLRSAGLYGAAYSLLDRVQFLPAVVMTTALPIVSAAWPADPERARRAVVRAFRFMTLVSFSALAFTIGAARPLIVLLFGKQFEPAAPALEILMGAFIPMCFGYLTGYLAVVTDRQRLFMFIAFGGLIFNVAGNLLLLPRYGYMAAAWLTGATELVVIVPAAVAITRAMKLAPDFSRLPRAAAAAAIMGVSVWAAHDAGADIFVLALLGAIVYPVAVLGTGALTPQERAELIGDVRRVASKIRGLDGEAPRQPQPDRAGRKADGVNVALRPVMPSLRAFQPPLVLAVTVAASVGAAVGFIIAQASGHRSPAAAFEEHPAVTPAQPPRPSPDYVRDLREIVATLNRRLSVAGIQLRETGTPQVQAQAASSLAVADASAAAAVLSLNAGSWTASNAALAQALELSADAYGTLARAATSNDPQAYAAAQAAVSRATTDLDSASAFVRSGGS